MDYNPNRDDAMLLHIKRRCLAEPNYVAPREYRAFAREWRSSMELGIDYNARLTDQQRDFDTFNRIDELHRRHFHYLIDYYTSREKLISSFGGAMFYLDDTLSAYNKAGDAHLLNELKENGIRIGTNFKKENVGEFVANIALDSPFETYCRAGQENYLRIFSEYTCYARYMSKTGRRWRSVNLIIIPTASCSKVVHDAVGFILEAEDMSANIDFIYPNIANRIHFLERISKSANDIFMLLDNENNVLFTNELFQKEFGWVHNDSEPEPISSVLPVLAASKKFSNNEADSFNLVISLPNVRGVESVYTVFGQRIEGYGHRLCFVPSTPGGQTFQGTKTHYSFRNLIGKSESFSETLITAQRASQSLSNVLIIGESGTGKELIAQSIHSASPRNNAPFIPVNCASIPKELINSELMGFEEGAFTGSRRGGQAGKFELANGGTIFLDEISEMPMDMQCSLLRILEDRVVNRLGGARYYPVDTRVIAATNKDLYECVQRGTFRLDLYFRLNVIRIEIPPLRERDMDIELLVSHLLELSSYKNRMPLVSVSPEVMELFKGYSWPGNVRELKNIIERCVIMASSDLLALDSLPRDIIRQLTSKYDLPAQPRTQIIETISTANETASLKSYENKLVAETLAACKGNKSLAAKKLGISRSTLYKRMQEIGLA